MLARGTLLQNLESKEDGNFGGSILDTNRESNSLHLNPLDPLARNGYVRKRLRVAHDVNAM